VISARSPSACEYVHPVSRALAAHPDMSDKYKLLQSAMAASEHLQAARHTARSSARPALAGDGSNRIEFRHVWFTYQKLTEQRRRVKRPLPANRMPQISPPSTHRVDSQDVPLPSSRTIGSHRRPHRSGKNHAHQPDDALLRRDAGRFSSTHRHREHDLTALRQHFAVVLQDPFLFTGTLPRTSLRQRANHPSRSAPGCTGRECLDFIESLRTNSTSRCRSAATRSPRPEAAHQLCPRAGLQSPILISTRPPQRGHRHRMRIRGALSAWSRPDKCADRHRSPRFSKPTKFW